MSNEIGKFITFEGGDGCGKTTQARLLFETLNESGIPVLFTREPGGTDGAEEIRNLLVTGETGKWDRTTETLMFFAARHDHVEKLIKPALQRGEWVICDRFTDSTLAYQGYGHGVKLELIKGLHRLTLGDFQPDLTFIFDLDTELGIKRATARIKETSDVEKEDRYERMGKIFHNNVRRGFLEIAKENSDRCFPINANDTISDLHIRVVSKVNLSFKTTASIMQQSAITQYLNNA